MKNIEKVNESAIIAAFQKRGLRMNDVAQAIGRSRTYFSTRFNAPETAGTLPTTELELMRLKYNLTDAEIYGEENRGGTAEPSAPAWSLDELKAAIYEATYSAVSQACYEAVKKAWMDE